MKLKVGHYWSRTVSATTSTTSEGFLTAVVVGGIFGGLAYFCWSIKSNAFYFLLVPTFVFAYIICLDLYLLIVGRFGRSEATESVGRNDET